MQFGIIFTVLILFFLFWGEPDVWDNLHKKVMIETAVEQQTNKTE